MAANDPIADINSLRTRIEKNEKRRAERSLGCASAIAAIAFLNWRTWHIGERTKDATITFVGSQFLVTPFAVVEIPAGVRRHRFGLGMSAMRTGKCRLEDSHEFNQI
jgi:hypothetical protein